MSDAHSHPDPTDPLLKTSVPSSAITTPLVAIDYESKGAPPWKTHRPWWACVLLAIYLQLVASMLAAPVFIALEGDANSGMIAAAVVTALAACGLAMIWTPVRIHVTDPSPADRSPSPSSPRACF